MATNTKKLPESIILDNNFRKDVLKLRRGTYLIQLKKDDGKNLEGYLRISKGRVKINISIDLYKVASNIGAFSEELDKIDVIPIFNAKRYHSYLRVTKAERAGLALISLNLSQHIFKIADINFLDKEFSMTAKIVQDQLVVENPILSGSIYRGQNGSEKYGTFQIKHVSSAYKKIKINFLGLPNSTMPNLEKIKEKLKEIGIDAETQKSNTVIPNQFKGKLSNDDLLNMVSKTISHKINSREKYWQTWQYYFFIIDQLDEPHFSGKVITEENTDIGSLTIPALSTIAIASLWDFNCEKTSVLKNTIFSTEELPYFRTCIHEILHAIGISDHTENESRMNQLITPTCEFLEKFGDKILEENFVKFRVERKIRKKINHMPDPYSRPGLKAHDDFDRDFLPDPLDDDNSEVMIE